MDTALAAAGRKKTSYRTAALLWLQQCLAAFEDDYYSKVGGERATFL